MIPLFIQSPHSIPTPHTHSHPPGRAKVCLCQAIQECTAEVGWDHQRKVPRGWRNTEGTREQCSRDGRTLGAPLGLIRWASSSQRLGVGTSLAVQRFQPRGEGLIPGEGTQILPAVCLSQKIKPRHSGRSPQAAGGLGDVQHLLRLE